MTELGTTNIWLAVIAMAAVLQTAMLCVFALMALRFDQRVRDALDKAERAIEPVVTRLPAALDDIHWLSEAGRRTEDSLHATVNQISSGVHRARGLVLSRFRPILFAMQAVRTALSALATSRRAIARDQDDDVRIADFIAEGAPAQSSR